MMRVWIHDYGGYPFTLELAQALADSGSHVRYCYSAIDTARSSMDLGSRPVEVSGLRGAGSLQKSSFVRRFQAEVSHGKLAAKDLACFRPDVVLSANSPLESQW